MKSDYNYWINTRKRSRYYRIVTWRKLISTRLTEHYFIIRDVGMALSLLPFLPGSRLHLAREEISVPLQHVHPCLPASFQEPSSLQFPKPHCLGGHPVGFRLSGDGAEPSSLFQFLPQKQPSYRSLEFCFLVLAKPGLSARQLRKQALFCPGSSEQPLYTWVSSDC